MSQSAFLNLPRAPIREPSRPPPTTKPPCTPAQTAASQDITERIRGIYAALQESGPEIDPRQKTALLRQAQELEKKLEKTRASCLADARHGPEMRELLATLRDVVQPSLPSSPPRLRTKDTPPAIQRLRSIEKHMDRWAQGPDGPPYPAAAQALASSQTHETYRQRAAANHDRLRVIKGEMWAQQASHDRSERQAQAELRALRDKVRTTQEQLQDNEKLVQSLRQRLDLCQGNKVRVGGVYQSVLQKAAQDKAQVDQKATQLQAELLRLRQKLPQLEKNIGQLRAAEQAREQQHQEELKKLRREFAARSKAGGRTLSQREVELGDEVHRLEALLHQAKDDLKHAVETTQGAMSQLSEAQRPRSELARMLQKANADLQRKNRELLELTAEADGLRNTLTNIELQHAQSVEAATERDRRDLEQVSRELAVAQQKLAQHQQSHAQTTRRHQVAFEQARGQVARLEASLRAAEGRLGQEEQARQQEARRRSQQAQHDQSERQAWRRQAEQELQRQQERLREKHRRQAAELEDRFRLAQHELAQERQALAAVQAQMQAVRQTQKAKEDRIARYQAEYEKKQAAFVLQQDALKADLAQARQQAAQFASLENDYRRRETLNRQAKLQQREEHQRIMQELQQRLRRAEVERGRIQSALAECAATRESLVVSTRALTEENARLKSEREKLQAKLVRMRARYEAHADKMRTYATKLQGDVTECAQRLRDASQVHDHVQRMTAEAREHRQRLQKTLRHAEGQERALAQALQDREVEKSQVLRLQAALQDCASQRRVAETRLRANARQLQDTKKMEARLATEIQDITSEFRQALQTRDAQHATERLDQRARVEGLELDLQRAQAEHTQDQKQAEALARASRLTNASFAQTEQQRSAQVQTLLEAQQALLQNSSASSLAPQSSNLD